ncbi:MAG: MBL fold metallo-hydrolase [Lachnospiraceae bacterium]|nr:MBL fold metallo-hydrolase [Lachnospiraceae bacterium]
MSENIEVFTQNSIRITCSAGRIYIDPFKMKEEPHDADIILITHEHYDHFSPDDIKKVSKSGTVIVVPEKMLSKAKETVGNSFQIVTVKPSERKNIGKLEFETLPAYNKAKQFHPKAAEWVGYIVNADGKRVYIAGDTDATEEARKVKCDVALVPIGGTYTMDPKEAAELVNEIKPQIAIPVHYGDVVGSPEDGKTFKENVKPPVKVELKISF